jgi:hypothetical protein
MDNDDQFLNQVLLGIAEAEIITIFFPLLRCALVVDTRHSEGVGHMVRVLPQVGSMEERIAVIEKMRPQFGKVRSILGIPWMKSINSLREQGIVERLVARLSDSEMSSSTAQEMVRDSVAQLAQVERRAFISLIRGEGYQTLWSSRG